MKRRRIFHWYNHRKKIPVNVEFKTSTIFAIDSIDCLFDVASCSFFPTPPSVLRDSGVLVEWWGIEDRWQKTSGKYWDVSLCFFSAWLCLSWLFKRDGFRVPLEVARRSGAQSAIQPCCSGNYLGGLRGFGHTWGPWKSKLVGGFKYRGDITNQFWSPKFSAVFGVMIPTTNICQQGWSHHPHNMTMNILYPFIPF